MLVYDDGLQYMILLTYTRLGSVKIGHNMHRSMTLWEKMLAQKTEKICTVAHMNKVTCTCILLSSKLF